MQRMDPKLGQWASSCMVRRGRQTYRPVGGLRTCRLGKWLARLGVRQTDLAKAVKITDQYVSELVSGKKDPGIQLALAISAHLEITVNELYSEPPSSAAMQRVRELSPGRQALLARLMAQEGERDE